MWHRAGAGPEPMQPRRAAEVRRKYLRPVAPGAGRERVWAADLVRRAGTGERVPRTGAGDAQLAASPMRTSRLAPWPSTFKASW
jgi:hypothetical protein